LTLLTVFTDCTERSPTFRLHPLDTVHDKIGKSWIKIKTPSSDAASAWETLLRRPFHGLEPSIYQTPFEEQVGDEVLRKAALASLAKAGDVQQELYNFAFSNGSNMFI
jgi:N-acetylmuramic acid 6-phosphate etherase